jgi:hypothetical protein
VGIGLSRGLCWSGPGCLWKYCILLTSPCPRLPKPSGCGHMVAWGPSWFLCLTWSGDSLHRLELWGVSSISPRFLLISKGQLFKNKHYVILCNIWY